MNPKSLASLFLLLILGQTVVACRKSQAKVTVRITVSDANTTKVWRDTSQADTSKLWVLAVQSGAGITLGSSWTEFQDRVWPVLGIGPPNGKSRVISDEFKQSVLTEGWISTGDSNANDAQISSIKVSYVQNKGKRIEDNIGKQAVGAEFSKDYQIPSGSTITVTAWAKQTGETKYLEEQFLELLKAGNTHEECELQVKDGNCCKNSCNLVCSSQNGKSNEPSEPEKLKLRLAKKAQRAKEILAANAGKRVADARVRLTVEILQNGVVIGGKELEAELQAEATGVALVVNEK